MPEIIFTDREAVDRYCENRVEELGNTIAHGIKAKFSNRAAVYGKALPISKAELDGWIKEAGRRAIG